MKTILLFSIIIMTIAFPILAARARDPRRGMRRMAMWMLIFNAIYLFYVTRLHPVLFIPQRP